VGVGFVYVGGGCLVCRVCGGGHLPGILGGIMAEQEGVEGCRGRWAAAAAARGPSSHDGVCLRGLGGCC
jgi:hypothetical protein